jgi:peroxiredoxin
MCLWTGAALAGPRTSKPWLGLSMTSGPGGGVFVDVVFRGSPAAKAKLQKGDMITEVDGVAVDRPQELVDLVKQRKPGVRLKLEFRRGGRERTTAVELAEHPGAAAIVRLMHVGRSAPAFAGLDPVAGRVEALDKLRGDVVVIDFFASWCVGCKALAPKLAGWHRTRARRGLKLLGITSDEPARGRKTVRDWKIPYDVASDESGATSRAYRVSAIPAVFLVNRKGVIVDVMIGYDPNRLAAFEKHIDKLLAK